VPYEPLQLRDVELPERQTAGDYKAPALPPRFIPTPF
jgi:polyphosphate kinase